MATGRIAYMYGGDGKPPVEFQPTTQISPDDVELGVHIAEQAAKEMLSDDVLVELNVPTDLLAQVYSSAEMQIDLCKSLGGPAARLLQSNTPAKVRELLKQVIVGRLRQMAAVMTAMRVAILHVWREQSREGAAEDQQILLVVQRCKDDMLSRVMQGTTNLDRATILHSVRQQMS